MTEKILPYDRNIVPQETGWWCGPASLQVTLSSRGIAVPEPTCAAEIEAIENPGRGDDRDGTDYVGLIERVLDRRLPDARYTSVYLEQDPPTRAQVDRLWDHIVRSINAGYPVIMNWVAPPSNKPRGVKGSPNPRYSGGTTYHYVTCVGYDDVARALYIADSGFWPHNYWISFDQAATLIPPKGYCYAEQLSAPPVGAPAPAGPDVYDILTRATGITYAKAQQIFPTLRDGLKLADCTNWLRIAMALAQWGHESAHFNATEEYASGDAYDTRTDLGNTPQVDGDGRLYKGRTWIQVTGKDNYRDFSRWAHGRGLVPTPDYFVVHPQELSDVRWAGIGAAWYWTVERPDINALCDRRDLDTVTRRINGGTNGIADRRARYNRALAVGEALMHLLGGDEDEMAGWDQTKVDRAMVLLENIAGVRRKSRSPLRWPGEGEIETTIGFAWSADANVHVQLVEKLAVVYGDPTSIALLIAVANTDEPGRDGDRELARRILARVSEEAVQETHERIEAWLEAEKAHKVGV
ncbi:lysin A [Mycobacterium phage Chupacabra]|uniref:Lysin A n=3 Tax=Fromanvirus goose TaxID=1211282 RepID=A0A291AUX3_9CAUD|nr:endolysin [Mycobacterium phage Goose]AFU20636.1 LysA [Mycobacterium phage Goose]ATE84752.1 lysin A [Mycobacterium phage OKCentral2016]QHB41192.1 lysin A [Mycobacterium phage Chupacabra]